MYILVIYLKFYVRVVVDQRKHCNRKTFQKFSNFLIVRSGWSKCLNKYWDPLLINSMYLKKQCHKGFTQKTKLIFAYGFDIAEIFESKAQSFDTAE